MFAAEFSKELARKMAKIQKKNKVLFESILGKIREVKEDPEHYKPLRHDLKGYRRVHVLKSFVLIFKIDYQNCRITFEDIDHHDKIYRNS
jgi:YafQ family addiction module toxin component